ncbi:MAG: NrtA/SsuA/CpmA family ABC transporter substrate-binding protein [Magnetococcales bacterium]|nr:NrtA/SsuA/CpmA family ABC transporter substrate-binding protein [Magnetococcales bacterium]
MKNTLSIRPSLMLEIVAAAVYVFLFLYSSISHSYDLLSEHPLYRQYHFDNRPQTVHIGIQPLWLSGSLITEVMRRDSILKRELNKIGMKVRFHSFLKGTDVNHFLLRGDLAAGVGGDMPTVLACAKGQVRVVSIMDLNFTTVVSSQPTTLQDLSGKTIGYAFGSNAHYSLLKALSAVELTEDDVRLIAMDVNQMPNALANGDIDAFSAWEPTPTAALNTVEGAAVVSRSLSSGYLYFRADFLKRSPQAANALLASQIRALVWIKKSLSNLEKASQWAIDAGKEMAPDTPQLKLETYTASAREALSHVTSIPIIPNSDFSADGRMAQAVSFLNKLGKTPRGFSWKDINTCLDGETLPNLLKKLNPHLQPAFFPGRD